MDAALAGGKGGGSMARKRPLSWTCLMDEAEEEKKAGRESGKGAKDDEWSKTEETLQQRPSE